MVSGAPDEHPAHDSRHLNAVALRFVGLLLLLGGGLIFAALIAIRQFPTALRENGLVYVVPGSGGGHVIDPDIGFVLAGAGGVLAAVGLFGLLAGQLKSARPPRAFASQAQKRGRSRSRRPIATLAIGVAVLVAAIAFRRWSP